MFRGAQATKVDDKGRIKLPADTKRMVEEQYPDLKKALFLTSVYGSEETLDGQGRILVPAVLRDSAGMRSSDVRLIWQGNHLEALSEKVFAKQLAQNALSAAEQNEIAHLGV